MDTQLAEAKQNKASKEKLYNQESDAQKASKSYGSHTIGIYATCTYGVKASFRVQTGNWNQYYVWQFKYLLTKQLLTLQMLERVALVLGKQLRVEFV